MGLFDKILNPFKKIDKKEDHIEKKKESSHLDQLFVDNFIRKGGKFLYCTTIKEISRNFKLIIGDSNYNKLLCYDHDLVKILENERMKYERIFSKELPFLTTCEYLIANTGDIMFNSNQLLSTKISDFSSEFIVYSTTSQIVKNMNDAMAGINKNYKGNIPSNISKITYYNTNGKDDNLLNYGNSNSKNLYLILFEDL